MAVDQKRLPQQRGLNLASNLDLGIAVVVIGILIVLVIPIQAWMLDILITLNIAASIVIILGTVYLREPLEFSVFPSLLLMTTLYRLCLNVASTRLILRDAYAGRVISAFGRFVVSGNYVVGAVVFAILVVIQFVVITRGAGRISEVAARFTLDAMPGKQMAIDADLNAGLITEDEARGRRQKIQREADFYGAMDGATKFVRGDAIAGIIITLVNIIGGFIIGALIRDMTLMDSLTTYTLLTIGDGIVTQIPALIVATSAGLIVTRTVSDTDLGQDLARQVVAYPRAVAVAGVAIVLLGLTGLFAREAFPPHIFGIVGLITIILAMRLTRAKVKREEVEQTRIEREKAKAAEPAVEERPEALLAVDPMEIEIGYGLIPLADPKQGGDLLTRITHIRRQLAQRRGLIVPPIRIRDNMQLGPNEYIIKIKEIAVARGELLLGHHLAMNPGIATEEVEGIETREPAFGLRAIWITEPQREKAQRLGYSVVDPSSVLATHLTEVIKSHGHELLTRQAVRDLIDNLKKTVPALVEELIPNVMSAGDVQKVLQNLLREKVSIRNLELIMETLADYVPICKDHDLLTEYVRQALSRTICADYLDEDGKMQVMTLDPNIEKGIIDSVTEEQGITYSALPPQRVQEIIDLSAQASEKMARAGRQPIFLCAAQARLHYHRILMRALPNVVVLSYNEIDSSVTLESEGMVS